MSPPRITLALLAYQQSAFIEDAVRSALAQACEPIEVLLSDDASSDDTFAKMQALAQAYRGPHQVVLRRNEHNLGIGEHCNALFRSARGQLIVLMAGDDISTPDRVAHIAQAWDASGQQLDLIASQLFDMGHDGQALGLKAVDDLSQWRSLGDWVQRPPHIVGASHAYTRRLFERFGPLAPGVAYEDQVYTLRAILSGGACTLATPLVHYRRGGITAGAQALSGPDFVAWRRTLNARHMAMHTQWLADAQTAGHHADVEAALHRLFADEYFWQAMLAHEGWLARLRAALPHTRLPLLWRLRKATQMSFPGLTAGLRRRQAARRLARQAQVAQSSRSP
jgi:glycosyltransferase involved in cell wall biosynthesis